MQLMQFIMFSFVYLLYVPSFWPRKTGQPDKELADNTNFLEKPQTKAKYLLVYM